MSETDQKQAFNDLSNTNQGKKRGSFSTWRGNKYPHVKLRGFYSDVTSNQNADKTQLIENAPNVAHSHSWNVNKEKHVPLIHAFDSIDQEELKTILEKDVHGATTEIIKITDFTIDGFLPKCFLPYYTPPGQLPRKVQIDRLKRLYQSMHVSDLLREKNLEPEKLMPIHRPPNEIVLLNVPGQDPAPFPPFLPLHYFDDENYEIWSPNEWLNKGVDRNVFKPLPARALLPNITSNYYTDPKDPKLVYTWQDVGVLDFNKTSKFWLVQKLTKDERVLDENNKPIINKGLKPDGSRKLRSNQYWIPRIQLQFLAEDPRVFAERVEAAYNERKKTETYLRYQFYIDSMPNEGVIELDQVSFKRMLDWTKNSSGLKLLSDKDKEDTISLLEKEVNIDFQRSMNKISFDHIVTQNKDTFAFVSIPPVQKERIPEKGCISDIPEYDFDDKFHNFSFVSLLTRKETIDALIKVRVECNRVAAMSLFQIPNKHMKIDEFEQTQTQQTAQTSLYLKDSWINTLKTGIRSCFLDSGKGWFNIKEKDWSVYQISKLKKFMELVKFSMQDSLRYLVQDSLVNYTQMIVDSCWQVVDIKDNFEWSSSDLLNSMIKPKKNPLFVIELIIDKTGPKFNINYENLESIICSLFEKAISSTQTVPQLEKYVMEDIFWSGTPLLESVGNLEPHIVELKETILFNLRQALIPLKAYAKAFDIYTNMINLSIENYIKDFEKTEKTIEQVRDEAKLHLKEKEFIEKVIPSWIIIGPFYVITSKIREGLSSKRKQLAEAILNFQARKVRDKAEEVNNSFRDIQRKLFEKPNNMEELHEHREWMKTITGLLDDKKDDISSVMDEFSLLDEFLFNLSNDDFNMKWGLLSWPWKISNMIQQVEELHNEEEERFRKLQIQDTANLNDRMDTLIMNVAGLSAHSNLDRSHEVANECRRLNKSLKECQELSALYNNRERLFGMPITNYDKLARLMKDFEPYRNLWITTSDWLKWYDSWMNDPIASIDAENIEKNVTESYKSMHKAIKQFQEFENRNKPDDPYYDEDLPYVQQVAVEIKNQIEDFRPNIPLIQALRNPGMRNRHWEMLTEELKLPVRPKKDLTFKKCLEMGFAQHIDKISKVAEIAGKEYTIEQALDKMESEWKPIKFEVLPYKNTGTYIVKASDEISQLLDDHIVMTQSMSFSPYKKAFEERISSWENKLKITQDVLDEWLICQRSWLYLEPIFSSEDIIRQLPVESKRYQTMERIWRKIMKQAKENPEVISLCPDARLRDQLKECNKLLEQVQKGLSEYLETKRMSFPRFYFLSDDELLQILSQTKDPQAVQPHLRKCFENISKVKFESDMRISTMYSAEDEEVAFKENIYPIGNVEDWMLEIERVMRESLRQIIRDSLQDYKTRARTEWVLKWPGQVVIAGCQTYWTQSVSKALEEKSLEEYHKVQLRELDDLRGLVRGKLTSKARQTLSALIVVEVHARDVVINLINEKVLDVNDFEWISQLRYYWMNENLYIRAVNAEFLYGYEYLGNSSRLVITPLTDRCYLTLTGALHLKFGGAPAGPAGTGKTETTKDLAKAMAIQCVVYNCSDQLDFMAMGKFFKGLASAGSWACFDEFNRIDLEVLSVVAQQVATIQKASQTKAERFIFEGVEIALKPSCAVFITMNPGYAGRTELPDNLKALFRPVAMMVPDYALIAEISLFSFGFSDAKMLAKKIVTTFKLSSEQLSSQDHYDFGMRAVKSVISAAGNLKRQNPDMNEELICLRAIRDVNVPKFLQEDLKLFNGIVSDLFPKIKEEPIDYGALEDSLRKSCRKLDIKDVDNFILKCIQLYETTIVRHGLMLVGPTGSGKTKCYETLKAAMSALAGQPSPAGTPFEIVHTYILNPKSITMGQLYGEFDPMTHEWTAGILSCLMELGVKAENNDKRWYVFDGPVDAVWIENMNTVLDDNKKLCLTSGEIIKMTDPMTMMFEVADLAVASPATVSRCGMVYLEPSILGLKPFVECWIRKLPENLFGFREKFSKLFDAFLEPAIQFIRKNAKELIPTMDSNLTFSLLKMYDCFLAPYRPREAEKPLSPDAIEKLPELIEPWFIFSLIWSVGATCDYDGRKKFSEWLRVKLEEEKISMTLPKDGLVYDYLIDDGGIFNVDESKEEEEEQKKAKIIQWKNWMQDLPELVLNHDTKFSDIIVPTIDNIRNAFLIEFLLKNDKTVLCVGPTGTGKTLTIADKLTRSMPKDYSPEFIVFSAKTSANQTQDLIDSKLDKRRKGIYGPPLGKYFVFFIDDLNMPALDLFGAQPPIELIRQWMDFRGWYDRKAVGEFRNLVDINFCCAMGPPGGGRNQVTMRLTRHFNHLGFLEMEEDSMKKIFGTILNWWIKSNANISNVATNLIQASIYVYKTISSQLLPTPAKSHYTFNLRDLSKTFQGILMAEVKSIETVEHLSKLWYHESCRVFQDRLINDEDRNWFSSLLKQRMKTDFGLEYSQVITKEPIIYGDFMIPNADPRIYAEIDDFNHMKKVIEDYLEDYNQLNPAKMRLVLFLDAMRHIARISRIIRQPFGNALLLGVGGSGRQSLTRLSAHMAEYECFQIELSKNYGVAEWREDLKKVMLGAGLNNTQYVFLFSDTQIKSESFLEDLNNILNAGDVPNIYSIDELDQIYTSMKSIVQDAGLAPTKTNLFSSFTKRVRNNLHTVICMSPIGEIFRARLRQFPALVNCCTIDWFSEWPKDALESVAMKFLHEMPDLETTDEIINGLMNICQEMHQTVVQESIKYKEEQGRYNYVTPTSYLELLSIFSKIFGFKKNELIQARKRTKTGLDKLLSTEKEVTKLRGDLEQMQPLLEEAVQEAVSTMETIAIDSKIAAETRTTVQVEEEEAIKKARDAKAIADDAQRDLDEALPALDAALSSLKSLNRNDITEVRSMRNPPDGVRLVMEAVCIMKKVAPKKVAGDKPGIKVDDYTEPARTLLSDPGKFLEMLFTYEKDNIADSVIQKIEPYIQSDKFTPAAIAQVSKACTSICQWVRAMHKYHFVNKSVAPKREAQHIAQEDLAATQRTLAAAKARLKEVEEKLATLQAKYDDSVRKKAELEVRVKECEEKVLRAGKLVSGLGDEKVRWAENVKQLEYFIFNVIGDVLVASGFIAYLGPFTSQYREQMTHKWIDHLTKYKVPHTESPEVVRTLGDPVKIRNWQLAGLPKDSLSVQNGIVVQYSQRWPLFIDPQSQANKWIKNLEKENGLDVIKLSDRDFLRSLENAIRFGKPCLLENVGTELDPALEPVLLRQTYKQSGSLVIKLGDAIIPYHEDFKFYITTKLPNPHYTPEVSVKVTLINFTLSPSGLEDQMLGCVVAEERPDLEEAKNQLIISNSIMKNELKELEDTILLRLSKSENPVDDIELINALEASKIKSNEIKSKVVIAEQTEKDIDLTRSEYVPVAINTQILFFCVSDLANIDPMYQYSLEWFTRIFLNSITHASKADTLKERIVNINEHFTYNLYTNVCRSLFEKHKLLFAFLLTVRILMNKKKISPEEYRFFLAGGTIRPKQVENPSPSWISDRAWGEILTLESLNSFQNFAIDFKNNLDTFKKIFDSSEAHREPLPEPWKSKLDSFQRIIILKCLRPDKVTNAMQDFVAENTGQRFIEPQTADLHLVFKDSSASTPLIFVLSQGTDPAADLYKFADEMKFSKKLSPISLGQGQGPKAEAMLKTAMERGLWVFFQNCHLAPSWMPSLERLVEQIDPEHVHKDFRLWLTSMPSPKFPVMILQNGSKMTVEPPRGIKANLLKSYNTVNDDLFLSCTGKVEAFKHLLFCLCLFHGVTLERRKFGSLGFNIPYEFTDGDLRICMSQLKMFLMEYAEIPYKVLKYTAGHINYGGRVTDDWDRRCIMNILEDFYNPTVLDENFSFDESKIYHQLPTTAEHPNYVAYVRSLPINDTPEIFGLHDNANITFAQNETFRTLADLLELQPKTLIAGGSSKEEVMEKTAKDVLSKVPQPINLNSVIEKYPVLYEQSMNTVLIQEIIRYNKLLSVIHRTLQDLLKALKGLVVMSQELEEMSNSLFNNQVPSLWAKAAYPSLKPLAAWVNDLVLRMKFINDWISVGIPNVYWISGFFFPQAFLTGTLQNYARKYVTSIDTISFGFEVLAETEENIKSAPKDGCYIRGLFIEGARWNKKTNLLGESKPKELYSEIPVIWLIPTVNRQQPSAGIYVCPVYKTLTRAGTLSTTGHSTNFVFSVELPSDKRQTHWIKRGVAMLCALNY